MNKNDCNARHIIYKTIKTKRKQLIFAIQLQDNILWNHSYSWVPMFLDCQNFVGSWGHNFVGNWFVA